MEGIQQQVIQANIDKLMKWTQCSPAVLAKLESCGVFSDDDVEELSSISNQRKKSLKFYTIIQTRNNAFIPLFTALKETKQTGAVRILEAALTPSEIYSNITNAVNPVPDDTALTREQENLCTKLFQFIKNRRILCACILVTILVCLVVVFVVIFNKNSTSLDGDSNLIIWSSTDMFDRNEITEVEFRSEPTLQSSDISKFKGNINGTKPTTNVAETLESYKTTSAVTESDLISEPKLQSVNEFKYTDSATKPVTEILGGIETTLIATKSDFTTESKSTLQRSNNLSEFETTDPITKPTIDADIVDSDRVDTESGLNSKNELQTANFIVSTSESTVLAVKPTIVVKNPNITTTSVPNPINRCDGNILENDDEAIRVLFKLCPDSQGCPCWRETAQRDLECKERNYPNHWKITKFGFYTCFCCGKY